MLSIEETIKKINNDKLEEENNRKTRQNKSRETELLLEFFAKSFEEFVKQITNGKYAVEVKFPEIQKVKGNVSVEGLTALLHALNELKVATKNNKLTLPEIQKVEGEVVVKNPTPETKIPEYPKQIKTDVTSLPKYVQDLLGDLKKAIKEIEVKPEVKVETKASDVKVDLSGVKISLEKVIKAIKEIYIPETSVDFSEVIKACNETTKAIQELKFPVPNFQSSWSHSLSMRAEDLDKVYTWTTDGGKDVVETITIRDEDGSQWVRTYSYDGTGKVASETKWTRV